MISDIRAPCRDRTSDLLITSHARDIWLFSYLCNGMNIKDIVSLKFKNLIGDSIQYDRSKTSNTIQNPKPIVITLLPKTQEILERWAVEKKKEEDYIFPVLKKGISELQKKKGQGSVYQDN
jgi:integrase/recombinase XerD